MNKLYRTLCERLFCLRRRLPPSRKNQRRRKGQATNWVVITSGFAMAIASAFCGLAQGKATASAVEGMARNPGAAKAIQTALILGLALIESLALYTLVIIFAKVK